MRSVCRWSRSGSFALFMTKFEESKSESVRCLVVAVLGESRGCIQLLGCSATYFVSRCCCSVLHIVLLLLLQGSQCLTVLENVCTCAQTFGANAHA